MFRRVFAYLAGVSRAAYAGTTKTPPANASGVEPPQGRNAARLSARPVATTRTRGTRRHYRWEVLPPLAVRRAYLHRIRSLPTLPRNRTVKDVPWHRMSPLSELPTSDNTHVSRLFRAARRANSASPAARIASTGASYPVIRVNWATAWCSSMGNPPTTTAPAAAAALPSTVGHGA